MEEKFVQQLLNDKLISQESFQKILDIRRDSGRSYTSIIATNQIVDTDTLLERMEDYYGTSAISLDDFDVDSEVIQVVPEEIARHLYVIPLFILKDSLAVAVEDPYDIDALDYLKIYTGLKVQPFVCLKNQILRKLDEVYAVRDSLERAIKTISETKEDEVTVQDYFEDLVINYRDASPVVQLVNYIFQQAIVLNASDIHIEPLSNRIALRYRIDGILQEFPGPPKALLSSIISRIKILASLDVAERRHPQDGRMSITLHEESIDFRVSILPFIYGEGVVIRILGKSAGFESLDDLGFEEDDLARLKKVLHNPFGLVLATGPTGSGKSTTLYSALRFLNTPEKKIVTLEEPVEYKIDGVMQMQIREDIELSFSAGLRAVLRHDPDIVMLGEIRDLDSAGICLRLAMTGHLILSTLHTTDASSAADRLIDLGLPSYLVSETLSAVVAQRLLRKLCPHCKKKYAPEEDPLEYLVGSRIQKEPPTYYTSSGCGECNYIGYSGRMAIYELMLNEWKMRTAIPKRNFNSSYIRAYLRRINVRSLRESGLLKASKGITSLEEVYANTGDDIIE